jgi:hypothetical protein
MPPDARKRIEKWLEEHAGEKPLGDR